MTTLNKESVSKIKAKFISLMYLKNSKIIVIKIGSSL